MTALADFVGEGAASAFFNLGDLAAALHRPQSARAVGTAIGANPVAMLIPCHRVIRAGGEPGGYRWDITRKVALLGWEAACNNG